MFKFELLCVRLVWMGRQQTGEMGAGEQTVYEKEHWEMYNYSVIMVLPTG
jgi:hypothetical protein